MTASALMHLCEMCLALHSRPCRIAEVVRHAVIAGLRLYRTAIDREPCLQSEGSLAFLREVRSQPMSALGLNDWNKHRIFGACESETAAPRFPWQHRSVTGVSTVVKRFDILALTPINKAPPDLPFPLLWVDGGW